MSLTPVPFTLIDIGARQTRVMVGAGTGPDATLELVLGAAVIAAQFFKCDPPAPHELENAIDAVEDEVMQLRTTIAARSVLVAAGVALHELGRAAGATAEDETVTLEAVEQLFQRLASASLGNPTARHGLPPGQQLRRCRADPARVHAPPGFRVDYLPSAVAARAAPFVGQWPTR